MTEEDFNGTEEGVTARLAPGAGPRAGVEDQRVRDAQRREAQDTIGRQRSRQDLMRQLQALEAGQGGYSEPETLWAWCGNFEAGCTDDQFRVEGVRTTYAATYRQGGDDGPNADRVERSWSEFAVADPSEARCSKCGAQLHVGDQERPIYQNRSGFDQRALLRLAKTWKNGSLQEGTVVQAAVPAAARTPLETAADRLARGEIEVEQYRAIREALEETSNNEPETAADPTRVGSDQTGDEPLPKGVRRRGDSFQGHKQVDGRQVRKSFQTVAEAVAWRDTPPEAS